MKEKLFARQYVKSGNATNAVLQVYNTKKRKNARQIANTVLKREPVQQEIRAILIKAGLSLDQVSEYLHKAIVKGLDSNKASMSDALKGIDMVLKLNSSYPASRSLKLVYSKQEQVASKDTDKLLEELKKLNSTASSLINSTT